MIILTITKCLITSALLFLSIYAPFVLLFLTIDRSTGPPDTPQTARTPAGLAFIGFRAEGFRFKESLHHRSILMLWPNIWEAAVSGFRVRVTRDMSIVLSRLTMAETALRHRRF